MGILTKIANAPKWVIALISSAAPTLVGVVGWFWLDYNQFRTKQVEIDQAAAEQSIAADAELDPYVVKFKDLITGKSSVTQKDRDEFAEAIRNAYHKAEGLRNRYSSLTGPFEKYTSALVDLRLSINNLDGPLDGKKYFVALTKYVVAQADWKRSVTAAQSSYIRSFAFR